MNKLITNQVVYCIKDDSDPSEVYDNFLHLDKDKIEALESFCHFIWWKHPNSTLQYPERLIAQIMNLGTESDIKQLLTILSKRQLHEVLKRALPGWFFKEKWEYWHKDFFNEDIPPMPKRTFE